MLFNAEIQRNSAHQDTVHANSALSTETQARKAGITRLEHCPGVSTCSIPSHRHAGGDDACWNLRAEFHRQDKHAPASHSPYTTHCVMSANVGAVSDTRSDVTVDTGCSNHMFRSRAQFGSCKRTEHAKMPLEDNSVIDAAGAGDTQIAVNNTILTVRNALHVPDLSQNLLSVGQSEATGIKHLSHDDRMAICAKDDFQPPKGNILATVPRDRDSLCRVSARRIRTLPDVAPVRDDIRADRTPQRGLVNRHIWHQRLGHLNDTHMNTLIRHASSGMRIKPETRQSRRMKYMSPALLRR